MKKYYPVFATLFLLLAWQYACSQYTIFLSNASFEDSPRYAAIPGGWHNCAFNQETPPDIHPVPGGHFKVTQQPQHGQSYLGLVVRDNRTSEAVGQPLSAPLEVNRCYGFSMSLCRSEQLWSPSRSSGRLANYIQPAVLRIWGGISTCGQKSLLAESPVIANTDWMKYSFRFRALDSLTWISFEAYFDPEATEAYNGNILLDNISPIIPLDCETLEPLIDPDTLTIPGYVFNDVEISEYSNESFLYRGEYRWVVVKLVQTVEDLEELIRLNCQSIVFPPESDKLINGPFSHLGEIAFNVRQFPTHRLLVGVDASNEKLLKKRTKELQHCLRGTGLKKAQFLILPANDARKPGDWPCDPGLWLKLEAL